MWSVRKCLICLTRMRLVHMRTFASPNLAHQCIGSCICSRTCVSCTCAHVRMCPVNLMHHVGSITSRVRMGAIVDAAKG